MNDTINPADIPIGPVPTSIAIGYQAAANLVALRISDPGGVKIVLLEPAQAIKIAGRMLSVAKTVVDKARHANDNTNKLLVPGRLPAAVPAANGRKHA